MEQQKIYIADVAHVEHVRYGMLNLLKAPPNTGKSTWALNNLCTLIEQRNRIVYLIDSTAGRDSISKCPYAKQYDKEWLRSVKNRMIDFDDERIIIMTYAKFGMLLQYHPNFANQIQMLICDEMDGVFWVIGADKGKLIKSYPTNTEEEIMAMMPQHSMIYMAMQTIQGLWRSGKCYVVAMTATPRILEREFRGEIFFCH